MNTQTKAATPAEKIILKCRELYGKYGYRHFLMSKFEDYDLYADNRSFLRSDSVLTFTDRSGRLKALKPDVTLSIVKNLGEDETLPVKVFYNENVYRPADGGKEFSEIMQLGLESIGTDDLYSAAEVIMLAEKSLSEISNSHILDISHIGLLSELISDTELDGSAKTALTDAIRRKSSSAIKNAVSDTELADKLCRLTSEYTTLKQALPLISELVPESDALTELQGICDILDVSGLSENVYFDFSLLGDLSYYNGIIFQGFVDGAPSAVLSGGRYDPLLRRFGRNCGACGFAIYLDRLTALEARSHANDADILLLYGENDSPLYIAKAVSILISDGNTVLTAKAQPDGMRFGKIINISEVTL